MRISDFYDCSIHNLDIELTGLVFVSNSKILCINSFHSFSMSTRIACLLQSFYKYKLMSGSRDKLLASSKLYEMYNNAYFGF